MIEFFKTLRWQDGVEILILAVLLYHGYRYFRATRGAAILTGLLAVLILLTLLSELLRLEVIGWIIRNFLVFLAIGLVVIFQPEMRRALAEVGSSSFFVFSRRSINLVDRICSAVEQLANKRYGALLAIEAEEELRTYVETGVVLDAVFSRELLLTVFHPKTALHDGGLILTQERVRAAGCVFPVSQRELLDRSIGLRHRAGIGISEETDAVAIVVSEETGHISICHRGKMEQDLDGAQLRARLEEILGRRADSRAEEEQAQRKGGRSKGAEKVSGDESAAPKTRAEKGNG
jgi:diadenylate cyclase